LSEGAQVFLIDTGINLGRVSSLVPQNLADLGEGSAAAQHSGRQGVPQQIGSPVG